jgi:cysteinyl-tRNA synthetase
MEIVQKYTIGFHEVLAQFNTLPPSIEPTATGHIIEQIEMIKKIIDAGYAYEVDGTVYFDVEKYSNQHNYGILTNRKLEDLLDGTRELSGQDQKRSRLDFALWISAKPETLMQWPSPWGKGFPGWHIECSAMSTKYLGTTFDIHGGGMDLQATHHTNEIAQSQACNHTAPVKYWMHTNMLTVNGVRMSKSAGNGFLPSELFTGNHPLLDRGYSPMTVRFFMLQSHYRNTLDFSNEALQAAEKGYKKLMESLSTLEKIQPSKTSTVDITTIEDNFYSAMDDDFSSPTLIAHLFDAVRVINSCNDKSESINNDDLQRLKELMHSFVFEILGLIDETKNITGSDVIEGLMGLILDIRKSARENKDWNTSDKIRDQLKSSGVEIKDTKTGVEWRI